ncbi:MAG: CRR6 family NdhI maturation factor [Prochlorococcaceae cyanobacterium]
MSSPSASILVSADQIRGLDLAPLAPWQQRPLAELVAEAAGEAGLVLQFDWPRDDDDPRELSEIPELRLWSLRADALWPWLPLLLERSSGQLARHVAMLLPHSFSPQAGLRFAEGALELWISQRLFLLDALAQSQGFGCRQGLGQMAAVLGMELDPAFWAMLPEPS